LITCVSCVSCLSCVFFHKFFIFLHRGHHKLNFLNIVFIIFIFVMFGTSGSAALTTSKVYDLSPRSGDASRTLRGEPGGHGDFAPLSGTATKTEILTHPWWGEGTTTSPTNRHPISFTIKVRVILVSGRENCQRSQ
jgi:hypothetical protein